MGEQKRWGKSSDKTQCCMAAPPWALAATLESAYRMRPMGAQHPHKEGGLGSKPCPGLQADPWEGGLLPGGGDMMHPRASHRCSTRYWPSAGWEGANVDKDGQARYEWAVDGTCLMADQISRWMERRGNRPKPKPDAAERGEGGQVGMVYSGCANGRAPCVHKVKHKTATGQPRLTSPGLGWAGESNGRLGRWRKSRSGRDEDCGWGEMRRKRKEAKRARAEVQLVAQASSQSELVSAALLGSRLPFNENRRIQSDPLARWNGSCTSTYVPQGAFRGFNPNSLCIDVKRQFP